MNSQQLVGATLLTAHGLLIAAMSCSGPHKQSSLRGLAREVLDYTKPDPVISVAYRDKPAEQLDTVFLAENISLIEPVPFSQWAPRKIRATNWGALTRIMHGIQELHGIPARSAAEATKNRTALVHFIAPHIGILKDTGPSLLLTLTA